MEHKKHKKSVLFILKERHLYGNKIYTISSGLFNSANFVNNMLNDSGIQSNIVEVVDNNDIDREVTKYKPTHVIIEALWVVPEKFNTLSKLHPEVKWIIRLHSEVPFIANEGMAMDWIFKYQKYNNVFISVNSERILEELGVILHEPVLYLPNYYPVENYDDHNIHEIKKQLDELEHSTILSEDIKQIMPIANPKPTINVACFGAIRPMKNQLMQAIAAIKFTNDIDRSLVFHINSTRIENKGDATLNNILSLFENTHHKLVQHEWLSHHDFIKVIKKMDICMQVSISETFNIVTADAVNNDIPVVVSDEVSWVCGLFKADPTDFNSIVKKLKFTWHARIINAQAINKHNLHEYSEESKEIWLKYFGHHEDCGDDCDCE